MNDERIEEIENNVQENFDDIDKLKQRNRKLLRWITQLEEFNKKQVLNDLNRLDNVGRLMTRIQQLENFERQQKQVNELIIDRFGNQMKQVKLKT